MGAISGATLLLGALTIGSTVYQSIAQKKARRKARRAAAARTLEVRPTGSGVPVPVVYGRAAVQGTLVYAQTAHDFESREGATFGRLQPDDGKRNEYLLCQYVLCVSDIESVEKILVDDKDAQRSSIANDVAIAWSNGGTASAMATAFTGERSASDKFTGLTYITAVFKQNYKKPEFGGVPSITAIVKGRKVRSVDASGNIATTRAYSSNAVWVLLDYLTDSNFGPGLTEHQIDLDSFRAAGVLAEQEVQGTAPVTTPTTPYPAVYNSLFGTSFLNWGAAFRGAGLFGLGGLANNQNFGLDLSGVNLKRHEYNGHVSTSNDYPAVIESILEVMPGAQRYQDEEGRLALALPDSLQTPAQASVYSFDDHRLVSVEKIGRGANETTNRASVSFINANKQFATDEVRFPSEGSVLARQLGVRHGGRIFRESIDVEGANNRYHATSIAASEILTSLRDVYRFQVTPIGWLLKPGQVVRVEHPHLRIDAYVLIYSVQVMADTTVQVEGVEYNPADYGWIISDKEELDLQTYTPGSELIAQYEPITLYHPATEDGTAPTAPAEEAVFDSDAARSSFVIADTLWHGDAVEAQRQHDGGATVWEIQTVEPLYVLDDGMVYVATGDWSEVREFTVPAGGGAENQVVVKTIWKDVPQAQVGAEPTPTGGTYSFTTEEFTPPTGWSATRPAATGVALYSFGTVDSATADETGLATFLEWTAPVPEPGSKGVKGLPGDPGPKGDPGDRGEVGPKGLPGIRGPQGDPGFRGEVGAKGGPGATGPTGDPGFRGPTGDKGLPGAKGPKGQEGGAGETGEAGVKGERGPKGDEGDAGPKGERGDRGAKGVTGDFGEKGEGGPKGEKGTRKGEKGDLGPKGDGGPKGETGARGDRGAKGQTGARGAKGEPGGPGDRGAKGQTGDRGQRGDAGERGVKGSRGQAGLTGARGAKGSRGPRGNQGQQGLTGERGLTGDRGIKGSRGQAGLSGDRGAKGLPGPRGIQGLAQGNWRGEWAANRQYAQGDVVFVTIDAGGVSYNYFYYSINAHRSVSGDKAPHGSLAIDHWVIWSIGGDAIVGPKGQKGDRGATGAGRAGAKGQKGARGSGSKGQKGAPGSGGGSGGEPTAFTGLSVASRFTQNYDVSFSSTTGIRVVKWRRTLTFARANGGSYTQSIDMVVSAQGRNI